MSTPTFDNRYRTAWAGLVRPGEAGSELRVAGWVNRRRDHGGLIFIDLRDREGIVQLVFHPDTAPEAHAAAHKLRGEDVISVQGKLVERDAAAVNPDLPTGGVELLVTEFDLLADAETPPFQIDEDDQVSEDLRLRYRYLDLRKPYMAESIELRHRVVVAIRRHLEDRGFLEIETPVLTRSTPEGARDFLVPSRVKPGSFYALPQSPQLFKQLLMIGGFERYYQIAHCFRDEDSRADRLPEFTQLDIELAFVDEDDVIGTVDALMREVLAIGGVAMPDPVERMPYDEALLRYGTDRPDRRIPFEIADLSAVFAKSEFKVFSGALSSGGVVRGFAAPGEWPRRRFDELTERAQRMGAKGLVWGVLEEDGWRSPVAKFLSEEEIAALIAATGAKQGDAILAVADTAAIAARVLGDLRARGRRAGRRRRLLLDRRLPDVRLERGRTALGRDASPVQRARRQTSTQIPASGAAATTTWSGTAPRSAAARSASTLPRSSARCSTRSASRRTRRASASGSCSTRSPTGLRRTAASRSASTGSSLCSRAARRSAT